MYFWGMSSKFASVGCVALKKEIDEETVVAAASPEIIKAFRRKYLSICLVIFAAVTSAACICVVIALAIRNECTAVPSLELFDESRVVSFAVAEALRAMAFRHIFKKLFRYLSSWTEMTSFDMPALPVFDTRAACDVFIFLFHLINLLAIPFYLVFFVALDPSIKALDRRPFCLKVSPSHAQSHFHYRCCVL
jgi:hypothetical protein